MLKETNIETNQADHKKSSNSSGRASRTDVVYETQLPVRHSFPRKAVVPALPRQSRGWGFALPPVGA